MVKKSSFKNADTSSENVILNDILELDSLKIFCRKIYHWCKDNRNSIDISINISHKNDGTIINLGMQKGSEIEKAQEVINILKQDEELLRLEQVYKSLYELSIDSEYDFSYELEKIREKALIIKNNLYPEL